MRGRSFAVVHAYSLGTEAEGRERLAPLRALGPEVDTVRMVPPVELSEMHMDPPDPLPYLGEHLVLGDLPAAAIDDFVAAAGPGSGSTLVWSRCGAPAAPSAAAARATGRSTGSPASSSTSASA